MGRSTYNIAVLFLSCSSLALKMPLQEVHDKTDALHVYPNLGNKYHWASNRGNQGQYTTTDAVAPFHLSASLAWKWQDERGRYFGSPTGISIDDQKNIYMTELAGVRKFSPDGTELWKYKKEFKGEMVDSASMADGTLYFASTDGLILALSMETGKKLWSSNISSKTDGTNGFVSVHAGTIVVSADEGTKGSDEHVLGINATNGELLWTFTPDNAVWNFLATFPDDETTTFQDRTGKAYRIRLSDGSLMWKNGGFLNSWTDGSAQLGSNGIVYAVNTMRGPLGSNDVSNSSAHLGDAPGHLSAYRVSDGKRLWSVVTPRPPNNVPAIGRLAGRTGLSVVQPMGQQVLKGAPYDVRAYDADTGALQWVFNGPKQQGVLQAGDLEGMFDRSSVGLRGLTLPNPWSAPAIDGAGTVYVGNQEGQFYALRDLDGDGHVSGPNEVSIFETGSCYPGALSPAIAPGMVAVGNIDTMYVFKT